MGQPVANARRGDPSGPGYDDQADTVLRSPNARTARVTSALSPFTLSTDTADTITRQRSSQVLNIRTHAQANQLKSPTDSPQARTAHYKASFPSSGSSATPASPTVSSPTVPLLNLNPPPLSPTKKRYEDPFLRARHAVHYSSEGANYDTLYFVVFVLLAIGCLAVLHEYLMWQNMGHTTDAAINHHPHLTPTLSCDPEYPVLLPPHHHHHTSPSSDTASTADHLHTTTAHSSSANHLHTTTPTANPHQKPHPGTNPHGPTNQAPASSWKDAADAHSKPSSGPKIAILTSEDVPTLKEIHVMPALQSATGLDPSMGVDMVEVTWNNRYSYANRHGYTIVDGTHYIKPERSRAWYKVKALQSVLERFDWVFYLDAAAWITNPDIKIESLLPSVHSVNLVVTRSQVGMAGSLLIRQSDWSRQFLQAWWDQDELVWPPHARSYGPDSAFESLLRRMSPEERLRNVAEPPQCAMNSQIRSPNRALGWFPGFGNPRPAPWAWAPGHFLVHFADMDYHEVLRSLDHVLVAMDVAADNKAKEAEAAAAAKQVEESGTTRRAEEEAFMETPTVPDSHTSASPRTPNSGHRKSLHKHHLDQEHPDAGLRRDGSKPGPLGNRKFMRQDTHTVPDDPRHEEEDEDVEQRGRHAADDVEFEQAARDEEHPDEGDAADEAEGLYRDDGAEDNLSDEAAGHWGDHVEPGGGSGGTHTGAGTEHEHESLKRPERRPKYRFARKPDITETQWQLELDDRPAKERAVEQVHADKHSHSHDGHPGHHSSHHGHKHHDHHHDHHRSPSHGHTDSHSTGHHPGHSPDHHAHNHHREVHEKMKPHPHDVADRDRVRTHSQVHPPAHPHPHSSGGHAQAPPSHTASHPQPSTGTDVQRQRHDSILKARELANQRLLLQHHRHAWQDVH